MATAYGYDAASRLSSLSHDLTGATQELTLGFAYNPAGCLYQSAGTTTTRFLYDGVQAIGEYNTAGTLLRRHVPGVGMDETVASYDGAGTTNRQWLLADERGSIIALANASGTATTINTYDEYGVPGPGNAGRFQYTGQIWLPEASLYHYKARAYDPRLGRFMQTDPIGYGDGLNLYVYVGADPVNVVDPLGLSGELISRQECRDRGGTVVPRPRDQHEYDACVFPTTVPQLPFGGNLPDIWVTGQRRVEPDQPPPTPPKPDPWRCVGDIASGIGAGTGVGIILGVIVDLSLNRNEMYAGNGWGRQHNIRRSGGQYIRIALRGLARTTPYTATAGALIDGIRAYTESENCR